MIEVVEQRGSVADLHALDPFGGTASVVPNVWWCHPTDDAIVLGSRQPDDTIDAAACARAGLAVVRRRSGGGAVIVRHESVLWVDVVLPAGIAPDDVRGSMEWIGDRWARALRPFVDVDLDVHRGGMLTNEWSDRVCFSGVGPGELLSGSGKVVGLSQRRTRAGIRLQSLIYEASVAHEYRALLRGELPVTDPGGQSWVGGLDRRAIVARLAHELTID